MLKKRGKLLGSVRWLKVKRTGSDLKNQLKSRYSSQILGMFFFSPFVSFGYIV